MIDGNATAARGTAVLVLSQACFLVLGYLAVVIMAREFGPATYGAYGVIMSVLVWLEEAGRYAIPSATAKLVAETNAESATLELTAVILNLALYAVLFVFLWVLAPLLSSWFAIPDGALLFRIAAIDLPFFGIYTAYRAIHQGHRRFFRLGCSQITYALTKLVGALLLVRFGLSVKNALLVNVAATIVGLTCLLPGNRSQWRGHWLEQVKPLLSAATSMGSYYFVLGLRDSLVLWTLQIISPVSAASMIGVYVAAANIARVPSTALTTMTTVILPSISRAVAVNDERLARRYISQALRFGCIVYLPVCLVVMTQGEKMMQWIYSRDFSGGGVILALLIVADGLRIAHAIFGAALNAGGEARKAAIMTVVSLVPVIAMLIFLIYIWGGRGAALSSALTILISNVILGTLVWKRFGTFMNKRSAYNIGVAGCLMFLVFALLSNFELFFFLPCAAGLVAYFASLLVSNEITRQDVAVVVPWIRVKPYEVSGG